MSASTKREIYCYPKESKKNLYISRHKAIWESLGYSVLFFPHNLSSLFKITLTKRDVAVLNWFEDRVGIGLSGWLRFIKTFLMLVLIRLSFRKLIWVRHNLKPHKPHSRILYEFIIWMLKKLSDKQVIHRPVSQIKGAIVVPHPLYTNSFENKNVDKEIDFLFFGLIKPYKGLDNLLQVWPEDKKIHIIGKCEDKKFEKNILSIINKRKLDVDLKLEFLDFDELNEIISKTKFVIIAHQDNSMIVSGTFYHTISYGAKLLISSSNFYSEYLIEFPDLVKKYYFSTINNDLNFALNNYQAKFEIDPTFTDNYISSKWVEILCD
ncbi:MAG: hypothetical protein CMI12_06460 [Oceanospirillum sp.]|jgi:beta-1,4-mannosyltransferase|nr:hypothetical protein [Oceanospirillum sp.]|tara:strand:+ start:513 stop:1478 length:966 start_codon:yes stop_codon:yes gene_type:complete